ncbi:MAG TPA: DUF4349 domain-containing protein [Luteimonas sp.]|nr:DUF4349 domain-containing protein [Luteimonas sp.]
MPDNWLRIALCGGLLVLASCSNGPQGEVAADAAAPAAAPVAAVADVSAAAADTAGAGVAGSQLASSAATHEDGTRRFIRTARAEFMVADVYRSALAIEDLVAQHGGFVASNAITSDVGRTRRHGRGNGRALELAEYTTRGTLEVRVPGARTQAFLRALARQMVFLDSRTFEARDARLEILRQTLAVQRNQQAQQALGDVAAPAGKPGARADVLTAQAAARAARDEAEVARLEFEDRVALATLELVMRQPPRVRSIEVVDTDAAFRRAGPGFLSRAGQSLAVGWVGLLDLVVWMLGAWPLWLAAVAGLAAWIHRRRRRGRRAPEG